MTRTNSHGRASSWSPFSTEYLPPPGMRPGSRPANVRGIAAKKVTGWAGSGMCDSGCRGAPRGPDELHPMPQQNTEKARKQKQGKPSSRFMSLLIFRRNRSLMMRKQCLIYRSTTFSLRKRHAQAYPMHHSPTPRTRRYTRVEYFVCCFVGVMWAPPGAASLWSLRAVALTATTAERLLAPAATRAALVSTRGHVH